MKYKKLSTISKDSRPVTFLKVGMKSIAIKDTPRKLEAYMILPSRNGLDSKCRLLRKVTLDRGWMRSQCRANLMKQLLCEYPEATTV